jgi:hypothetical protein
MQSYPKSTADEVVEGSLTHRNLINLPRISENGTFRMHSVMKRPLDTHTQQAVQKHHHLLSCCTSTFKDVPITYILN